MGPRSNVSVPELSQATPGAPPLDLPLSARAPILRAICEGWDVNRSHNGVPHISPPLRCGIRVTNIQCYARGMQVTVTIPDDLAAQLTAAGKDPARAALEALAVEGYRAGRLSENEVRVMLGYETRMQVHALLKEHDVYLNYSMSDLEQDIRASDELYAMRAQSGRKHE